MVADWIEKTDVSPADQDRGQVQADALPGPDPDRLGGRDARPDRPGPHPARRWTRCSGSRCSARCSSSAVEGSEPLQAALGGLKNLVDQADVDANVPWMDPESREAERMRPKAAAFVRSPARPGGAAQGRAGAPVDGPAADGGPPAAGRLAGPRGRRAGGSAPGPSCRQPGPSRSRSPATTATGSGRRSASSIRAGRA